MTRASDATYIYDGEELPLTTQPTLRRPPPNSASPVSCDLRATMLATLMDGIHAAWNGWEQACKFEDEGLQLYYMNYVITLEGCLRKIKKI